MDSGLPAPPAALRPRGPCSAWTLPALELAFRGRSGTGVAAILAGTKTALTGLLQILEQLLSLSPSPASVYRCSTLRAPAVVIELTEVA